MKASTLKGAVGTNIKPITNDDVAIIDEIMATYKIDDNWRVVINSIRVGLVGMATYQYMTPEWVAFNGMFSNSINKLIELGLPSEEIKEKIVAHLGYK